MRTDLRTRVAGVAASATFAGALVLGVAAPALAVAATSTSQNGSVTQPGGFESCETGTLLSIASVPNYNGNEGPQTVTDETTGFSATFTKNGGDTDIVWSTASNVKVNAIAFFDGGNGNSNLLIDYSTPATSDTIFDNGTNSVSSVAACYTVDATPTPATPAPSDDGTPPPTSTVSSSNQDNGAWKLALVGVGGILATLAVVTPRRFRKNS